MCCMFFILFCEFVVADDLSSACLLQLHVGPEVQLATRHEWEEVESEVDDVIYQSSELLEDMRVEAMVQEKKVVQRVPLVSSKNARHHDQKMQDIMTKSARHHDQHVQKMQGISGGGKGHGGFGKTTDQPSNEEGSATPRALVVGTHHKSGSVLVKNLLNEMLKSLSDAGKKVKLEYYYNTEREKWRKLDEEHGGSSDIRLIQLWNTVPADLIALEDRFGVGGFRYLQIARDPVSLVISAYLYHMHSDDCANACPDHLQEMRNASLTQGLKMQSGSLLGTTLQEQHKVSTLICTKNPAQYRVMLLNEFSDNYDLAVAELYTFLAGGVVTDEIIADAKRRAVEHDVKRWSEEKRSANGHVHAGVEKGEVIALWANQNTELEPERAQVNKESADFSSLIESCQHNGEHTRHSGSFLQKPSFAVPKSAFSCIHDGNQAAQYPAPLLGQEQRKGALSFSEVAVLVIASTATSSRLLAIEHAWLAAFPSRLAVADGVIPGASTTVRLGDPDKSWTGAQRRFLERIALGFDQFPEKSWYFLTDDDTFAAPDRLLEELEHYPDPKQVPYYVGSTHLNPDRKFMFCFGGAGIALSNKAVKMLRPMLISSRTHLFSNSSCEAYAQEKEADHGITAVEGRTQPFYMAGDIVLAYCLYHHLGVQPMCHPGFSQYGLEDPPAKLEEPWVTRHYVEPDEMQGWADAQA